VSRYNFWEASKGTSHARRASDAAEMRVVALRQFRNDHTSSRSFSLALVFGTGSATKPDTKKPAYAEGPFMRNSASIAPRER
jgi:hypothetical protein